MKILYLTMLYSVEKNGLYQNLVDSLVNRNHEITIVRSKCDIEKTCLEELKPGIMGLNVKAGNPLEHNLIKKGINQILLAYYFKKAIKEFLDNEKYDLILYATPPVTLASVVKFCKNKYDAKTFLMLKDIFPQNAVDLNMMNKKSFIYKYFRRQEKKYYEYSDCIGCMSEGNKEYLIKNNPNINKNKICVFPNSITIAEEENITFHKEKTVFMFGGNLGKPQNITFLLNVIHNLRDYSKAEFWIVGKGTEKEQILKFIHKWNCKNLKYHEEVPQDVYENMLKEADVGIISLDPRFTIPNIPSRFQSYLKLKKPVLAITDTVTDLQKMIKDNGCGWWCDAFNEPEVIENIKYICEHKEEQIIKGEKGFEFLKEAFDVEKNVDKLDALLGL